MIYEVCRVVQHVLSEDGTLLGSQDKSRAQTEGECTASEQVDAGAEEPFLQIISDFLVLYVEADEGTLPSYVRDITSLLLDAS